MPHHQPARSWRATGTSELAKRFVSALILAGFGIGAILYGSWLFALMVAAVGIVLAWEWGRVTRSTDFDIAFLATAGALGAAVTLAALGRLGPASLTLAAATLFVMVWRASRPDILSAAGVPYIGLSAIGMIWLRAGQDGWMAVLFVFACVWAHDTAAMLTGRTFGGPRLWPSISPQKTWAGAIGGLVASSLTGAMSAFFIPGGSFGWLTLLGLLVGLAAFFGDLAESALKRLGGVKNASSLIPGHGGFLDRLDGAILSFALAALLAALINANDPARALLTGP